MGIILKIIESPPNNYHMYYYKVHPQVRNFSKFPSLYKIKHIQAYTLKEYPTLYTVCYHVNPRGAHTTRPHPDFEHKTKTKANHLLLKKTTTSLLFSFYINPPALLHILNHSKHKKSYYIQRELFSTCLNF